MPDIWDIHCKHNNPSLVLNPGFFLFPFGRWTVSHIYLLIAILGIIDNSLRGFIPVVDKLFTSFVDRRPFNFEKRQN
jgi:hypothetical protein